MSPLVEIGERGVKAKVRVVYEFVDESIVLECFSIVAEVKADVPIDILAFGIPGVPRGCGFRGRMGISGPNSHALAMVVAGMVVDRVVC